jgi:hypothetical protein
MTTIARQAITVDPDLHSIWGDLDGEVFEGLKSEIYADGIRDSLVLWKQGTENILIDGHNRLRIAELLHLNEIPVCWKEFSDKAEAAKWILEYQSSRRNITDGQKYVASESVQKIIREQARAAQLTNLKKGDASPVLENSPKRDKPINTRKEVAKAAGISEWKVRQGDFVREHGTPEQIEDLRTGKKSLNEAYKETLKAVAPKKADRIAEAEKMVEATKQEGQMIDLQIAKKHKEAEQRLLEQKARGVYDIIYNIMRECRKLTDEDVRLFCEVYGKKEDSTLLPNARSIWDTGQRLIKLGEWIQEVNK